jgi:type 1 glutamine amidotransferase
MSAPDKKIRCLLIAGGKYHDIDFARLELLKLLARDERVRVRVFEDYEALAAIGEADFIVTYTCDVMPSLSAQEALRAFLQRGGRWFALHGTNSILRFLSDGKVDSPRWAPLFMQTLGSMFVAHPPIAPYTVTVADPAHELVAGVQAFETTDELYLLETYGELKVLLETRFGGEATGFF